MNSKIICPFCSEFGDNTYLSTRNSCSKVFLFCEKCNYIETKSSLKNKWNRKAKSYSRRVKNNKVFKSKLQGSSIQETQFSESPFLNLFNEVINYKFQSSSTSDLNFLNFVQFPCYRSSHWLNSALMIVIYNQTLLYLFDSVSDPNFNVESIRSHSVAHVQRVLSKQRDTFTSSSLYHVIRSYSEAFSLLNTSSDFSSHPSPPPLNFSEKRNTGDADEKHRCADILSSARSSLLAVYAKKKVKLFTSPDSPVFVLNFLIQELSIISPLFATKYTISGKCQHCSSTLSIGLEEFVVPLEKEVSSDFNDIFSHLGEDLVDNFSFNALWECSFCFNLSTFYLKILNVSQTFSIYFAYGLKQINHMLKNFVFKSQTYSLYAIVQYVKPPHKPRKFVCWICKGNYWILYDNINGTNAAVYSISLPDIPSHEVHLMVWQMLPGDYNKFLSQNGENLGRFEPNFGVNAQFPNLNSYPEKFLCLRPPDIEAYESIFLLHPSTTLLYPIDFKMMLFPSADLTHIFNDLKKAIGILNTDRTSYFTNFFEVKSQSAPNVLPCLTESCEGKGLNHHDLYMLDQQDFTTKFSKEFSFLELEQYAEIISMYSSLEQYVKNNKEMICDLEKSISTFSLHPQLPILEPLFQEFSFDPLDEFLTNFNPTSTSNDAFESSSYNEDNCMPLLSPSVLREKTNLIGKTLLMNNGWGEESNEINIRQNTGKSFEGYFTKYNDKRDRSINIKKTPNSSTAYKKKRSLSKREKKAKAERAYLVIKSKTCLFWR